MRKIKAILVGAGDRGLNVYADYAINNPNEIEFVALAEPDDEKRERFSKIHSIPHENCFESWEALFNKKVEADAVLICTQDREHTEPTISALQQGYHVLLEKPMSPILEECIEMTRVANENNKLLVICHVLRYTSFWQTIKETINSGEIGEIVSIQLNENVGIMHMAHSFVRGNWNNSNVSSPMILQKSCHDMDILVYLLNSQCTKVSSFGSLKHFTEENAPSHGPFRCSEGCPIGDTCIFHAEKYYLGEGRDWAKKFTMDTTNKGIIQALEETSYGKCVYRLENNVVDHQVVNLEFENGATASFSMCGFTREETREVHIMGTKGDIKGRMSENKISIYTFEDDIETTVNFPTFQGGHSGGDYGLMKDFIKDINNFEIQGNISKSASSLSLDSHLIAFAAEESRLNNGKVINPYHYLK